MSEQQSHTSTSSQRPTTNDPNDWRFYWREMGQPWRTEPEIDEQRQAYLAKRRDISMNLKEGVYPFADVQPKLTRADVEWLLATHENGLGPVDWGNDAVPPRDGLNLVKADLSDANLRNLPLARIKLMWANLKGSDLSWAGLQGAFLTEADLTETTLVCAKLENAHLRGARLTHARMEWVQAIGADFTGAHLEGADIRKGKLEDANLSAAYMEATDLAEAGLDRSHLINTYLEGTNMFRVSLKGALLNQAHLDGGTLVEAHMENALLHGAHLAGASLREAHLEGANLRLCHLAGARIDYLNLKRVRQWNPNFPELLPGAELWGIFLSSETKLDRDTTLGDKDYGGVSVADAHWGDANLTVIDWDEFKLLGDERAARAIRWRRAYRDVLSLPQKFVEILRTNEPVQRRIRAIVQEWQNAWIETKLIRTLRLKKYQEAVRANRQIATILRAQGMNEEGNHFAYRAQVLQRQVLLQQGLRKFPAYVGSLLLDLLAGYGYRPGRSFLVYIAVIIWFANGYVWLGHLSAGTAWVFSMTSFHGRGFFPGGIDLDNPITKLAAIEALVGLIIEVSFIATFTQRFFGK